MAVPSLSVIQHGCLLHSLARADLTLQLLFNGATWYPVPGTRVYAYAYMWTAWCNFRRFARATKIKQCEILKGEIYLTQKVPDLRYTMSCTCIVLQYQEQFL